MRYLALLIVLSVPWAQAAMHVCRDASGNTVFQDQPCRPDSSGLSPTKDVCSDSITAYQQRIQSGQSNPTDRTCLKKRIAEQREAERLAAAEAERQRQEQIRKKRELREAKERKERQLRAAEERQRRLTEEAKRSAAQLRAFKQAQAKLVEPDDPELTKILLEKACMKHVLKTHAFKDPESVRLEGSELAWKVDESVPRYVILLNVNAKNSWGAYTGTKQYPCFLSEDGLRLSDVQELIE